MNEITNLAVAAGTLVLAFVAIFGDAIRSKLSRGSLGLVGRTLRGHVTKGHVVDPAGARKDVPIAYYHLDVVNTRHWLPAEHCRVLLREIGRKGDTRFDWTPIIGAHQFRWSFTADAVALSVDHDETVDFGLLVEGEKEWVPGLYQAGRAVRLTVRPGEVVRYQVEVRADRRRPVGATYEVAWSGDGKGDLETVMKQIRISQIRRGRRDRDEGAGENSG